MLTPSSLNLPSKFTSYRTEVDQEETIFKLATSNKRITLFDAPPGSGKSLTYYSVIKLLSARGLILTPTKLLENQLIADFSVSGLYPIHGHSNYACSSFNKSDNDELAEFECSASRNREGCIYRQKITESLSHMEVVSNLAHWVQLYKSDDPDRLGLFDILIIDEAHTIRRLLTEYVSIKLYSNSILKYLNIILPSKEQILSNKDTGYESFTIWLQSAIKLARDKYKELVNNKSHKRDIIAITQLGKNLTRLHTELSTKPDNWIITQSTSKFKLTGTFSGVHFSPVSISNYVEEYLFRGINRILLTSATLDKSDAADLGLIESDLDTDYNRAFDYIEISSAFDHNRRPIIYVPTSPPVKVDNRMTVGDKRVWVNRIDSIIEGRLDRNGLIQARSYDRMDEIYSMSRYNAIMIDFTRGNMKSALKKFIETPPPCILIGPAMEEGLDLPYHLCYYLIIPKVPFLDSRDPMIKSISAIDKGYKDREVGRVIVQMAHRGMRSRRDFCEIFITDSHWSYFRKKPIFKKWFVDAFRQYDTVPVAPSLEFIRNI